jgi:hypothetical protein
MTRTPSPQITLLGYHLRESDKAVLFKVHQVDGEEWTPESGSNKDRDHWFPLSQMSKQVYSRDGTEGEMDSITVSQWICEQKGLV